MKKNPKILFLPVSTFSEFSTGNKIGRAMNGFYLNNYYWCKLKFSIYFLLHVRIVFSQLSDNNILQISVLKVE